MAVQAAGWSGRRVGSFAVSIVPLSFEYWCSSFSSPSQKMQLVFVHADCFYSCEPNLQLCTLVSVSVRGLSNLKIHTYI